MELLEAAKVRYLLDLKGGRKRLVRSGLDTSRVDEQIRRAQAEHDPDSSTGKWIMQYAMSFVADPAAKDTDPLFGSQPGG